ncbi:MAG: hypothetical protein WBO29_03185 [Albidovulum sp.]
MDKGAMRGRRPIFLGSAIVTLLLTACGTPQEQCIRAATRELRTVTSLIAETEATIARGYGYQSEEIVRWAWVRCDFDPSQPGLPDPTPMCWEPFSDTVQRPVAIDPAVEARKLAGLKSRQKTLQTQANSQISNCRAQFPDPQ